MQILNEEIKSKRLAEFQELKTLDEKLKFWSTRLPVNFIAYHELGTEGHELYNNLHAFYIDIKDRDRKEFAKWVLNNYHDLSKKRNPYERLLDFDLLRKSFEKKLEDSEDKLETVRKELAFIRKDIKRPVPSGGRGILSQSFAAVMHFNKFNADYYSFEDYKEQSLAPDYQEVSADIYSILRVENGYTAGRYWKYLKELDEKLSQQNKVKEFTLDQKLLILHYLGGLKQIMEMKNSTKQADFLQRLISDDAEKTRQRFSTINDLIGTPKEGAKRRKLIEEITDLQKMFKELGLQNIVKKIQADLRKLSQ